jgi:hypothetical protein
MKSRLRAAFCSCAVSLEFMKLVAPSPRASSSFAGVDESLLSW